MIGAEPITRNRTAPGTRGDDGRYVDGATTTSTIYASVQPANGRDMEHLPEGVRMKDVQKLFAPRGTLRTASQHDGWVADEVVIDGVRYQVQHVGGARSVLPHTEALVVRVQEAE